MSGEYVCSHYSHTMSTEQIPHPIDEHPSQKRSGKSLDMIVTGMGQMIYEEQSVIGGTKYALARV